LFYPTSLPFLLNLEFTDFEQVAPAARDKVAACAKHFVGDGGTTKGINENNTVIDTNGLLSIHMPAYLDSINKGISTVMVSYSSWNGVKMHANRELITGYLKNSLKFKVITVHSPNLSLLMNLGYTLV